MNSVCSYLECAVPVAEGNESQLVPEEATEVPWGGGKWDKPELSSRQWWTLSAESGMWGEAWAVSLSVCSWGHSMYWEESMGAALWADDEEA